MNFPVMIGGLDTGEEELDWLRTDAAEAGIKVVISKLALLKPDEKPLDLEFFGGISLLGHKGGKAYPFTPTQI